MSVNIGGTWKTITEAHVNIGGTWKRVAEIWGNIGGTWKRAWQAIKKLYTEGVEDVAWVEGYSIHEGSQSKEADYLRLFATSGEWYAAVRTYVTDVAQNLSGYTKLKVDWGPTDYEHDVYTYSILIASSNKDGSTTIYDACVSHQALPARTVDTVDISGLSGNFYIRVHLSSGWDATTPILKVYRVWLE